MPAELVTLFIACCPTQHACACQAWHATNQAYQLPYTFLTAVLVHPCDHLAGGRGEEGILKAKLPCIKGTIAYINAGA